MTASRQPSISLHDLLTWQDGVIDTNSALCFLSRSTLRWRLRTGQWQQPCRGVFVAHSGPLTTMQTLWIAAFWAGPGAGLAGLTAARQQGLRGFDRKADAIHVLMPAAHTVRSTKPAFPLVAHYSRNLGPDDIHPARRPPQTRLARSLVDAATWMGTKRGAQAVLAAGVQQRLVRPADLAAEIDRNKRLYRRKMLTTTVADIAGGSHALSELDFTRLVIRQFSLPEPDRQAPRKDADGRRRWLDAVWEEARLVVEIDGAAHIDVLNYWDDMNRSNHLTKDYRVLRFPSWVVRYQPDDVAATIAQALAEAAPADQRASSPVSAAITT
jgi:hypothetical protein